jgi:histidinol dehydrogenase
MKERFGITYKDAAHRLYMAELEKVKSDEKMQKAFANLQVSTEQALKKAYDSIRKIQNKQDAENTQAENTSDAEDTTKAENTTDAENTPDAENK